LSLRVVQVDNLQLLRTQVNNLRYECAVVKYRFTYHRVLERNTETRKTRRYKAADAEETVTPLDPARARERVFQRAGKLLAAKPRSVEELRERLLEGRGATKAAVEAVIERLREYGYLDDARFAHSYASLRVQQRPIGRQRLQRDLWLKKIDKKTADAALDQVFESTPEAEIIDRAIVKRARLRGKPKTRAEAKKLFDHLLRQGFAFELVSEKVRAVSKSEVED
jgi:regulatory protein